MGYLDRAAIFAVPDLQYEDVYVPEWGGTVRVRGLTAAERDAYEASILDQRGRGTRVNMRNARAKLVVLSVVDGEGRRVFADGDAEPLGEKSAAAIDRIFAVAARLSGITDRDMEELVEDFTSGQSGDSFSA